MVLSSNIIIIESRVLAVVCWCCQLRFYVPYTNLDSFYERIIAEQASISFRFSGALEQWSPTLLCQMWVLSLSRSDELKYPYADATNQ